MSVAIKLKGFTLMELLVAMVLTGLIMMVGMSAISHFMMLVNTIKQNNERQTSIIQFFEVLENDVSKSDIVLYESEINCIRGEKITSYKFSGDYIIRVASEQSDTIRIACDNPEISFFENTELVNHISISCRNNGLIMPLDVIKIYPLGMTLEKIK